MSDSMEDKLEARLTEFIIGEAERDAFCRGWNACLDMAIEMLEENLNCPRTIESLEEERKDG